MLDYRLFIGVQLSDRNWFILWSDSLLVKSVEQAPIADVLTWFRVGGLLGLEVISGEIDEFFGGIGFPVPQKGQSKIFVHKPSNFHIRVFTMSYIA